MITTKEEIKKLSYAELLNNKDEMVKLINLLWSEIHNREMFGETDGIQRSKESKHFKYQK